MSSASYRQGLRELVDEEGERRGIRRGHLPEYILLLLVLVKCCVLVRGIVVY